ncbi:glycerol-3-phosphate responsive antiterminator [Alkalihalobacillus pseudalcaliphilus]|uniref:glycerol-3-phosphate responsive antiterminator n=1 Tax=Alkalihalobacillus pseudalcaliphilus TaxID=79884 RepID=UPI00064E0DEF|nr:glycerol-3-phosphate responsive antiterminator [Alkalihalobacillus pseudalcaliphilus]KMK77378.1 antiterminator [Alkalihalobacillus pseudalcaliphilus]
MKVKEKNLSIVDMVETQVIASILEQEHIEAAIQSEVNIAFLVTGSLLTLEDDVNRLKDAGMYVFVHLDFIGGLASNKDGIQYLARKIKPHGIITTKNQLIKMARAEGLLSIQRTFLIDSSAINKSMSMIASSKPDAIEVLPGVIPKVIEDLCGRTDLPIIAGGLISQKEEVMQALEAGSLAVSGGNIDLWNMKI